MNNKKLSNKELEILNKKANGYTPFMVTAGAVDSTKAQKSSWLSTVIADKDKKTTDVYPLTEERLRNVKKHDVVDVGHKEEDVLETLESQLSNGNNKRADSEILEVAEIQLDEIRADEIKEVLTEGNLEESGSWNEVTWEGDDIKIYRDINARQKENAKANEEFYKKNKDLTDGGKGTVSASKKKAQVLNPNMQKQEIDQIVKIYNDAIRAAQSVGGTSVTSKAVLELERARDKFINDANQTLQGGSV